MGKLAEVFWEPVPKSWCSIGYGIKFLKQVTSLVIVKIPGIEVGPSLRVQPQINALLLLMSYNVEALPSSMETTKKQNHPHFSGVSAQLDDQILIQKDLVLYCGFKLIGACRATQYCNVSQKIKVLRYNWPLHEKFLLDILVGQAYILQSYRQIE